MSIKRFLFITILTLLLASCGNSESEPAQQPTETVPTLIATETPEEATATPTVPPPTEPVPTATPEPSPQPTNTPIVEAESAVTDESPNELVVFESLEGGYSFTYPEDWIAEDFLGITLMGTDESQLDNFDNFEEGAFVMVLNVPTEELLGESILGNLMQGVTGIHPNPEAGPEKIISGPTELEINGYPAGKVVVEYPVDSEWSMTSVIMLMVHEEWAVSMIATTPSAEADVYLPIFEMIANSFTISAPVVTTDEDEFFSDFADFAEVIEMPIEVGGSLADVELPDNGRAELTFEANAGTYLDISVVSKGDFDAVLELTNLSGDSLVGIVDNGYEDEEILGFKIPADDVYNIVVYEYLGMSGTFSVELNEVEAPAPLEAKSVEIGQSVDAILATDEVELWRFGASAGDSFFVTVAPEPNVDILFDIVDENQQSIIGGEVDEGYSGGAEATTVTVPKEGTYMIQISGFAGDAGGYSLTVEKQ